MQGKYRKPPTPYDLYLSAHLAGEPVETPEGLNVSGPESHAQKQTAISNKQFSYLKALQSGEPLPEEMRLELLSAFEEIYAGISSELLSPVKRPGRPYRPIRTFLQGDAIRYLRWVEDGRISDNTPLSTVANCYGVTEKTVQTWAKNWQGEPTPFVFGDEAKELLEQAALGLKWAESDPDHDPKLKREAEAFMREAQAAISNAADTVRRMVEIVGRRYRECG